MKLKPHKVGQPKKQQETKNQRELMFLFDRPYVCVYLSLSLGISLISFRLTLDVLFFLFSYTRFPFAFVSVSLTQRALICLSFFCFVVLLRGRWGICLLYTLPFYRSLRAYASSVDRRPFVLLLLFCGALLQFVLL